MKRFKSLMQVLCSAWQDCSCGTSAVAAQAQQIAMVWQGMDRLLVKQNQSI
jgi:hypothetical protein